MAPDRTILHLVKNNYGVHTIKPHLRPWYFLLYDYETVNSFVAK